MGLRAAKKGLRDEIRVILSPACPEGRERSPVIERLSPRRIPKYRRMIET